MTQGVLPETDAAEKLTEEHFKVLACLARGCTNANIAKHLKMTEYTVKYRVNVLLVAFQCEHRYNIVAHAYARGFLAKMVPEPRKINGLTNRQTQILGLLAAGLDTDGMADALGISHHTLKTLISNLFKRMGAHNRSHAVALGHQHKFLVNHWTAPADLTLREGWIAVRNRFNMFDTWTPYPVPHPAAQTVANLYPGL